MTTPRILNNDPLTTTVLLEDPYYAYYFTGTSMGRFDHDNQLIFKFIGYNPDELGDPYADGIIYSYAGNFATAFTSTPLVSTTNGWLNGTLKNIGANITTYTIDVTATTLGGSTTKNFEFTIVGGTGGAIIDDTVTWNTGTNLGTINNGAISDLTLSANIGSGSGKYRLVSGSLPPGLEVLDDGNISGRVEFNLSTLVYTFTVEAYSSLYPTLVTASRTFTLTVIQKYEVPYDTIYMNGLFSIENRTSVTGLLNSITATQLSNIYRPNDPYFGVSKNVCYQHQYGVKSISDVSASNQNYFYTEYIQAVQRNFYWKFLTLGALKTAIATDINGDTIYEVVYSEIIDNLVNADGVSISKKVGFQNPITTNIGPYWTSWTSIFTSNTYYDLSPFTRTVTVSVTASTNITLNSVADLVVGMQITAFPGVTIVNNTDLTPPVITAINSSTNTVSISVAQTLTDKQQIVFNDPINVSDGDIEEGLDLYPNSLPNMREQIVEMIGQFDNSTLLPQWMNTQQPNGSVLGYVPCWVLCYTKPGKSAGVLATINAYLKANNLTLNQFTFQIDRITIDRSLTYEYGSVTFDQWATQPSTSVNNNSRDSYIQFPRKTILY